MNPTPNRATFIPFNPELQMVEFEQKMFQPLLQVLQALVGGMIERVALSPQGPLSSQFDLIVDEEGLLKELPYNHRASLLVGIRIVGNAVLMPQSWWTTDEEDD